MKQSNRGDNAKKKKNGGTFGLLCSVGYFLPQSLSCCCFLGYVGSRQTRTSVVVRQYLIFSEEYLSLCLRLLLTSACHSASNLLAICVSSYYISRAADSLIATLCVCVCVCVHMQSSNVQM